MYKFLAIWFLLTITVNHAFTTFCFGQDSSEAKAIMYSVVESRENIKSYDAKIEYTSSVPPPIFTFSARVEQTGTKRRFATSARNEDAVNGTVILNGDTVIKLRPGDNNDIAQYNLAYAKNYADLCFDLRCLGLTYVLTCDKDFKKVLLGKVNSVMKVAGTEDIAGIQVWHVTETRGEDQFDYWIEKTNFRVHKSSVFFGKTERILESLFDNSHTSMPSQVNFHEKVNGVVTQRGSYSIRSFEANKPINDDRFSISSLEAPINTGLVNHLIKKTVGFWNGKEIVPNRIVAKNTDFAKLTDAGSKPRPFWIALNILVIFAIGYLIWRRRKQRIT